MLHIENIFETNKIFNSLIESIQKNLKFKKII